MATIRPFRAIRPADAKAGAVATLPYDVMNREEARQMLVGHPESFLHVVRADADLPDSVDMHAPEVYTRSRETLDRFLAEGIMHQDEKPMLYIYRMIMDGRVQTGLVLCASVDEYLQGTIRKHELTLEAKEQDRIRHFDACDANTAPIFLAYRAKAEITGTINDWVKFHKPNVHFFSEDEVEHFTWAIDDDAVIRKLVELFAQVPALYIADGHHRCASSAKVGLKRRAEHPDAPADAEFNRFLAVVFPDEDLFIMDYNRLVKDLNGLSPEAFLARVGEKFSVREVGGSEPYRPMAKGHFGMYLGGKWYELLIKAELVPADDPIERLDVALLQRHLLQPILGIDDPRTSDRIDFVGGIRGLGELEKRCHEDMTVAFSMYPTAMDELLGVADAGKIMPPKSTWFEPKLRSGLFVHKLS